MIFHIRRRYEYKKSALVFALSFTALGNVLACDAVPLSGRQLTLVQIDAVARKGCPVTIDLQAMHRASRSFELLLAYAQLDRPVYGLNRGVGLNKDQTIFKGGEISPVVREVSERFNRTLLRSHSAAYGKEVTVDVGRATMLIRLNSALVGGAALQPAILQQYADFLNNNITPIMYGEGSVGQGDITVLPQIGLAMLGEGEVHYRQQRMSAAQAINQAGMRIIKPFGKDALGIVSSNAYGAAIASLALTDARRFLDQADAVAALSLEGLNGNLAPSLLVTQNQRVFKGQTYTAEHLNRLLAGSTLWTVDPKRPLQDPLSFRTVTQVHGAARDMLNMLEQQLVVQINSSDDNPTVALDAPLPSSVSEYEKQFYVLDGPVTGAVLPSAGFDPSAWALPLQGVTVALSQVAQLSAQRSLRLTDSVFTGLPRFLSPGGGAIGYGPIQKTVSSLASEIRALSHPVLTDVQPQAGNIEDTGTNAPSIGRRVAVQLEMLSTLFGVEVMIAAQAVDLRMQLQPQFQQGQGTAKLWNDFRALVPYMEVDRRNDADIAAAQGFIRREMALR